MLEESGIVDLKVKQEGGNGGVPRNNEGVSARMRTGKEGKEGKKG